MKSNTKFLDQSTSLAQPGNSAPASSETVPKTPPSALYQEPAADNSLYSTENPTLNQTEQGHNRV